MFWTRYYKLPVVAIGKCSCEYVSIGAGVASFKQEGAYGIGKPAKEIGFKAKNFCQNNHPNNDNFFAIDTAQINWVEEERWSSLNYSERMMPRTIFHHYCYLNELSELLNNSDKYRSLIVNIPELVRWVSTHLKNLSKIEVEKGANVELLIPWNEKCELKL
jgi:hypothetical protein